MVSSLKCIAHKGCHYISVFRLAADNGDCKVFWNLAQFYNNQGKDVQAEPLQKRVSAQLLRDTCAVRSSRVVNR